MEVFGIQLRGEDKVRERLKKFGSSPGLNRVVGRAAEGAVKEHFFRLDDERENELGGKRSHFYWEAGKNTTHSTRGDDTVVISTRKLGLRQRYFGGEIHAINGKYLTIPARSESYGVRAKDFPGKLKFVMFASGSAALVLDTPSEDDYGTVDDSGNVVGIGRKKGKKKRLKKEGLVEYWLVPYVNQQSDPSVLPTTEAIMEKVRPEVTKYLSGFNV